MTWAIAHVSMGERTTIHGAEIQSTSCLETLGLDTLFSVDTGMLCKGLETLQFPLVGAITVNTREETSRANLFCA